MAVLDTSDNYYARNESTMLCIFHIQKGGQRISWRFVEDLYIMGTKSQGLTTQHKLKYEHIYLTSFSKMRVDLAAQVRFKKVICLWTAQLYYTFYTFVLGFEQHSRKGGQVLLWR